MSRLGGKRKFWRLIYSYPSVILLSILAFFISTSAFKMYAVKIRAKARADTIKEKIAETKNEERFFENEIKRLSSKDGVEGEVRKRFRVAKEGEGLIIITDEGAQHGADEGFFAEKMSLWAKFLNLLSNL